MRRRPKQLDLHNVSTHHGDGWQGWQARVPLDAIIVTAAPPEVPTALIVQLGEGGILVLPVSDGHQFLKQVRHQGGEFIIGTVEAVHFVPSVKGELVQVQALNIWNFPGYSGISKCVVIAFPVPSPMPCMVITSLVLTKFS